MRATFFIPILIASALTITSCQHPNQEKTTTEAPSADTAKSDSVQVVTTSLTDDKGDTLHMAFDNAAGTATFVLHQDTIHLKQDTMASGIRYSNQHYIYNEHQGDATLTKDGKVVFKKGD